MTLIKWSEEGGRVRLGLPSDLDLPMAQPLVDSLRHGFQTGESVTLMADAVERVSTACVQAMLIAAAHATETGRGFAIATPSEALRDTCDDLGLGPWLKQWSQS